MSDIPALKAFRDELRRTGVLSKEFSSDLLSYGSAIAQEAYERGRTMAKEAAQADLSNAQGDLEAVTSQRDLLLQGVHELLARAWKYDDKPHQLFSQIRVLAEKYDHDPDSRKETIRLMDYAYENKGKPAPIKRRKKA